VPLLEIASSKTLKNVKDQNETTATKWQVFWKAEKSRSKSKTHRVGALVKTSSLVFPRRTTYVWTSLPHMGQRIKANQWFTPRYCASTGLVMSIAWHLCLHAASNEKYWLLSSALSAQDRPHYPDIKCISFLNTANQRKYRLIYH
jgi:hypothetical protein